MKALLLSAGHGTRLRPLTQDAPKPALPFLGIPILHWLAYLLKQSGVDKYVVNAHYLSVQIQDLVQNSWLNSCTKITFEKEKALGSGGGLWWAREHFKSEQNFCVANGDEIILPGEIDQIKSIAKEHIASKRLATITVIRHPEVGKKFGGVWADQKGHVSGFGKQAISGKEPWHNIGIYFFSSKIFDYLPEGESNILYDAVVAGIKEGEEVKIAPLDCLWYETGHLEDYGVSALDILNRFFAESVTCPVPHANESIKIRKYVTELIKDFDSNIEIKDNFVASKQQSQRMAKFISSHPLLLGSHVSLQSLPTESFVGTTVIDGWGTLSPAQLKEIQKNAGVYFLRRSGELFKVI